MDHSAMNHSMEEMAVDVATSTAAMDHSMMDHSMMDHSMMDHSMMDHSMMDDFGMGAMDHSNMEGMDHSNMAGMDHSNMAGMDHSNMAGMDHSNMAGMSGMHGMKMWFHFGANEIILFPSWIVHNGGSMVWTCGVILAFCFVMEAIRWLRLYVRLGVAAAGGRRRKRAAGVAGVRLGRPQITLGMCLDSVLHAFQLWLSYVLMLLFMTYNLWICFAVVLGEVISRFLFNVFLPIEQEDQEEAVATCCG